MAATSPNHNGTIGGVRHDVPIVIVLAASTGGLESLMQILSALPPDFPAAMLIVLHRMPHRPSMLSTILQRLTPLPVKDAVEGEVISAGTVYVASPDQHLVVTPELTLGYTDGRRIRHVLSSANPLFESVAAAFGRAAIGVVLSGHGRDATDGVQSVRRAGGIVIAQEPSEAHASSMPSSAILTGAVDHVVPVAELPRLLVQLVRERLVELAED